MTSLSPITVQVHADTSQFIAAMGKAEQALKAVVSPSVKPGVRTTEFWLSAVAPTVVAVLTLLFHRDFSVYVQAAALAATGVSTAVYAISRAHLKRPVKLSALLYDARALLPIARDAEAVAKAVSHAVPTEPPAAT